MRKPTAETSLSVRLQAAALAIRTNCRKHGTSKNGKCGVCPFYSKISGCVLHGAPPKDWKLEEEENDSNVTRTI